MRKWICCLLLVLASHGRVMAASQETTCAEIAPRSANVVNPSIAEIAIDESRSTSEDMAVMSGLYNVMNRSIGGLTAAEPLVEYRIEPNLAILPDQSGVCARPAFKLTIGYSAMNVYMDREIPRSSCIYNAIFAHEMHHVAIYKDYLAQHLEPLRQRVDEKFNGKAYVFRSIGEAKQYVEILGQVFAQHVREQFFGEVIAEQQALDTLAEYTRMQSECRH